MFLAVRIRSDISDPKIHTKESINVGRWGMVDIAGSCKVKLSLVKDQVRLALLDKIKERDAGNESD